jgi:uncharacterized protein (TIGR02246 family)
MLEGLLALGKDFDDAFNNNDAAAFAALFTKDAVLVTNTGSVYGPDAIVKYQAEGFKSGHFSNLWVFSCAKSTRSSAAPLWNLRALYKTVCKTASIYKRRNVQLDCNTNRSTYISIYTIVIARYE